MEELIAQFPACNDWHLWFPKELLNISLRKQKREWKPAKNPWRLRYKLTFKQVVYLNALDEGFWSSNLFRKNIDFVGAFNQGNNLKQT